MRPGVTLEGADLRVGTTLWGVSTMRGAHGETLEIVKVGRKFLYLSVNGSMKSRAWQNGKHYTECGLYSVYRSQQDYRDLCARANAWESLRRWVSAQFTPPEGLSTDRIVTILAEFRGEKGLLAESGDGAP